MLNLVASFAIMPIVSLDIYVTGRCFLSERDLIDSFIGITDKLNITVIAIIIIRIPPSWISLKRVDVSPITIRSKPDVRDM